MKRKFLHSMVLFFVFVLQFGVFDYYNSKINSLYINSLQFQTSINRMETLKVLFELDDRNSTFLQRAATDLVKSIEIVMHGVNTDQKIIEAYLKPIESNIQSINDESTFYSFEEQIKAASKGFNEHYYYPKIKRWRLIKWISFSAIFALTFIGLVIDYKKNG